MTNLFVSSSDILGEIYIDASITLDSNVSVDSTFEVSVSTAPYGPVTVYVTITNGNNVGNGSTYVGMGSTPSSISGECIAACDNPSIVLTGFTC
jgi:hypothetical protein